MTVGESRCRGGCATVFNINITTAVISSRTAESMDFRVTPTPTPTPAGSIKIHIMMLKFIMEMF